MNKISGQFTSIEQVQGTYLQKAGTSSSDFNYDGPSFENILKQASYSDEPVKFSKHAASRLESRNITLSSEQNERLEAGIEKASEKGIKDSLVVVDSLSFIVNVPNKTVVTAMDQTDSNDNIYTNIDGAVII